MGRKGEMEHVDWRCGGVTLRGIAHPVARARVWVVFAHGFTGHHLGPDYLFVKLSRALVNAGAASLRFDFGGCGESDGRFCDLTLSSMREDLLSAIRFVRRRFDASRVYVLGHSLGGAAAALAAVKGRLDGLILLAPVSNPAGLLERRKDTVLKAGKNRDGFYENGPHEMSMAFVNDLKRLDPVRALDGFDGPMVVFQGDHDKSVSVEESQRYIEWATRAGVPSRYYVVSGNDHNFSTVGGVAFLRAAIAEWLRESV